MRQPLGTMNAELGLGEIDSLAFLVRMGILR